MASTEPPRLEVFLEILGRAAEDIEQYEIESSFITPTDGFRFTLYNQDPRKLQGLELQPVTISIDGNPQLLGRIEITEGSDDDGSAIVCHGRDYIADLIECHVDPTAALRKGMTLADAIKIVAGPVGISEVLGDDAVRLREIRTGHSVGGAQPGADFIEAKLEDYKAEPGEADFQHLNSICARHGCLMQPGSKRSEIVLAAPNYTQPVLTKLVRRRDPPASNSNTIMKSRCRRDGSQFPTFVLGVGKAGAVDEARTRMKFETGLQLGSEVFEPHVNDTFVVNRRLLPKAGPKTEPGLYRLFYRRDTDARNQAQLTKSMLRATAERLRPLLEYECTVRGHTVPDSSALYASDTMIAIEDEVRAVSETLWCERVTFRYDEAEGPTATLGFVRPGTYVL